MRTTFYVIIVCVLALFRHCPVRLWKAGLVFLNRHVLCGAVRGGGPDVVFFSHLDDYHNAIQYQKVILWCVPNCSTRHWYPESFGVRAFWFQRIGKGDAGSLGGETIKIFLQIELGYKLESPNVVFIKNNYY